MNKNPVLKSENTDTPVAEKPVPVVAKAVTAANAAAPSQTGAATKVTRVSRTPAVKKPAVTAVAKPAAKPAVATKTVRTTAAKVAVPVAKRPAAAKPVAAKPEATQPVVAVKEKARKAKLVRDSFTMPEDEFAVLGKVKKASLKAGFEVKKSELLRIGVALVDQLSAAQLKSALASLVPLKAGRPKKDK